jgi:hypothetical protein
MATILPGTDLYEKYRHSLIREVDTYFSLGIEFDRGRRIASDDALIDSDPAIFCSFYNLPCPAVPLKELNEIASYFTIIASLYPRTFFLLSLELNEPIRDLFFAFLDFVSIHHSDTEDTEKSNMEQEQNLETAFSVSPENPVNPVEGFSPHSLRSLRLCGEHSRLTPQACLAHFADFAAARLARHGSVVREYIPEVLKYETCLLRAARDESRPSSFHIDLGRMGELKPLRNEKISIEQFTFDLPSLIVKPKCGHFPDNCGRRGTFLAFSAAEGCTQVREINEFGFDFLRLCDGRLTLEEIANQLYSKYRASKERDQFALMCAEAAGTLTDLKFIASFDSARSQAERR